MMKRREFIGLLGGAALAWPLAARAQQTGVPIIGYLDPGIREPNAELVSAFRGGLAESGYVEGQNVAIEYRWASAQYDRLPVLAADLVSRKVAVIAAMNGVPTALAAKAATATVPIVFFVGVDPVAFRIVESLNRPGGNITGVTGLGTELGPKRLEMLNALRPAATLFAMLVNPSNAAAVTQSRDVQMAASALGLRLEVQHASTDRDLEAAFTALAQIGVGGVVIGADGFMNSRTDQIAALGLRHLIPTVYQYRGFVAAGGLMSYGGSITASYRLVGGYAGRVLKGEKPGDLPVQRSTKVELFINLKTARALGLDVPPSILARADEVIE
jgi:putative tryptophan/tyrosine transport system substrate-binding protein